MHLYVNMGSLCITCISKRVICYFIHVDICWYTVWYLSIVCHQNWCFFFTFSFDLLTFCQYAIVVILIMTFICCMFHVYVNQFGAH